MNTKLYVGNLPFQIEEKSLEEAFSPYGTVKSVKIITDHETGRSRGFGFVEMETADEAQECVDNLDGKELEGRQVRVNIAREKSGGGRPPRGGGGGGGRW